MPSLASSLETAPVPLARARRRFALAPARAPHALTTGLLGFGNVGQAVARLVSDARLNRHDWRFRIGAALVRDATRNRHAPSPALVTTDASAFLQGRYDVVIEALGAVEP